MAVPEDQLSQGAEACGCGRCGIFLLASGLGSIIRQYPALFPKSGNKLGSPLGRLAPANMAPGPNRKIVFQVPSHKCFVLGLGPPARCNLSHALFFGGFGQAPTKIDLPEKSFVPTSSNLSNLEDLEKETKRKPTILGGLFEKQDAPNWFNQSFEFSRERCQSFGEGAVRFRKLLLRRTAPIRCCLSRRLGWTKSIASRNWGGVGQSSHFLAKPKCGECLLTFSHFGPEQQVSPCVLPPRICIPGHVAKRFPDDSIELMTGSARLQLFVGYLKVTNVLSHHAFPGPCPACHGCWGSSNMCIVILAFFPAFPNEFPLQTEQREAFSIFGHQDTL